MVQQLALSHTLHLWSMSEAQQYITLLKPTSYLKHLALYMICTPLEKDLSQYVPNNFFQ